MNVILIFALIYSPFASALCPEGSVRGIKQDECFEYNVQPELWYSAEDYCQQRGGHLASVSNAFLNSFLLDKYGSKIRAEEFWLGASNSLNGTNKWGWTDGSAFQYENWQKGEPQNGNDLRCSAALVNTTQWYDVSCFKQMPFICKLKAAGDTVVTPGPMPTCPPPRTLPTCPPPVTCPAHKSCPDGWTWSNVTNRCYKPDCCGTFDDSREKCGRIFGQITSIHSDAENFWITDLLLNVIGAAGENAYIGLHAPKGKCDWQWIDGTPVDYTNWGPGEPSLCNGSNWYCAVIVYDPDNFNGWQYRKWHTVPCSDWHWRMCSKALDF